MARAIWKGPFVRECLIKKVNRLIESGKNDIIKTWSRESTIIPMFVRFTFTVYNGHKFIPVSVTEEMVGRKFGEFAPTRTFYGHSGDKKVKRK